MLHTPRSDAVGALVQQKRASGRSAPEATIDAWMHVGAGFLHAPPN